MNYERNEALGEVMTIMREKIAALQEENERQAETIGQYRDAIKLSNELLNMAIKAIKDLKTEKAQLVKALERADKLLHHLNFDLAVGAIMIDEDDVQEYSDTHRDIRAALEAVAREYETAVVEK